MREEALRRKREHQRQLDGDQRVKTRDDQFDTTVRSGTNNIRTEQCATVMESHMSDNDSDIAKMYSDDESTQLHIHDCDVRDDAEEVSTIYAGEIHTRLAEETIFTSAPRVPTQEKVAARNTRSNRYMKHNDDLEWEKDNTVPQCLLYLQ